MTLVSSAHYHIGSGKLCSADSPHLGIYPYQPGLAIAWGVYGPSFGVQNLKGTWQDDASFLRLAFGAWAVRLSIFESLRCQTLSFSLLKP